MYLDGKRDLTRILLELGVSVFVFDGLALDVNSMMSSFIFNGFVVNKVEVQTKLQVDLVDYLSKMVGGWDEFVGMR